MSRVLGAIILVFSVEFSWAKEVTIAALGDSLVQGYGLSIDGGFVPQLEAWLIDQGEEVTIINAGVKENLIPGEAQATVNFRTQPSVTREDVIAHVKKVVDNENIKIIPIGLGNQPNQVAKVNSESFKNLQKTISAFKKDIVVAPYLVLGATDGRYFGDLTSQVFRFIPFTDPEGFHGVNERIKVSEFKKGINFYYELMKGI